jgi:hypothetical protein
MKPRLQHSVSYEIHNNALCVDLGVVGGAERKLRICSSGSWGARSTDVGYDNRGFEADLRFETRYGSSI